MAAYKDLTKEELLELKSGLQAQFEEVKARGLKLDMSRGKPAAAQLNLSMEMMNILNSGHCFPLASTIYFFMFSAPLSHFYFFLSFFCDFSHNRTGQSQSLQLFQTLLRITFFYADKQPSGCLRIK